MSTVKRPSWVTVVGVMGIISASLGIINAGQEIFLPEIMAFQKKMFIQMQDSMEPSVEQHEANAAEGASGAQGVAPEPMFNPFLDMFDTPDWFVIYSRISGVSKVFICAFYLLACIFLLQMRHIAIRLFYWASGLSIALALVKVGIGIFATSALGISLVSGGVYSVLIDGVLLMIVAIANKEAFLPATRLPAQAA